MGILLKKASTQRLSKPPFLFLFFLVIIIKLWGKVFFPSIKSQEATVNYTICASWVVCLF